MLSRKKEKEKFLIIKLIIEIQMSKNYLGIIQIMKKGNHKLQIDNLKEAKLKIIKMNVQFKITNDKVTMQEALKIAKEADQLVNVHP